MVSPSPPDGKHFYVATASRETFACTGRVRWLADERTHILARRPGGKDDGVPDGIKVDKDGNLYVTGPKGIWVWDAAGKHIGTIVVPEQPPNLTWGEPDYSVL